ncbi:3-keto-5-aminohexanoate cleavage protein [Roseovarius salis]|uniref:3-keto-5-aminohexanoate cleavage protein n=1 Tax=Roseovarius salis TaxID=3376063 RepID=UPI0037CC887B
MKLPRIMVAPNGAHLHKSDHPAVPLTLPEIVECAAQCHARGAGGLHLHLRDARGRHLLDPCAYRAALRELSERCPGLMVQVTTEAAGLYSAADQRRVAFGSGARFVSVALREMLREPGAAPAFYRRCADAGIVVQHILYDLRDARLLKNVLPPGLFRSSGLQLLFVLGRHGDVGQNGPAALTPFLGWMAEEAIAPDWAACAFGRLETECLLRAAKAGGKCRVGFENSILGANGEPASGNPQRVAELHARLSAACGTARAKGPDAAHAGS